jgi:hypothetical protein
MKKIYNVNFWSGSVVKKKYAMVPMQADQPRLYLHRGMVE